MRIDVSDIPVLKLEGKRRVYADELPRDSPLALLQRRNFPLRSLDTLEVNEVRVCEKKLREVLPEFQLVYKGKELRYQRARALYRGDEVLEAFVEGRPFSAVKKWVGGVALFEDWIGEVEGVFLDRFRSGPLRLEGRERRQFLEGEPLVEWVKVKRRPLIFLEDATGCLARFQGEASDEADLIEAGYGRKGTGFYCPGDRVEEALRLLLEVGWEVRDYRMREVALQTGLKGKIVEDRLEGRLFFGGEERLLEKGDKGRLFLELEGGKRVGMVRRKEVHDLLSGIDERGKVKRGAVALLDGIEWEGEMAGVERLEQVGAADRFTGTLLPYQKEGVSFLYHLYRYRLGGLLADEMGLGKTVQVLAFFSLLPEKAPILIVAPKSLLPNWRSEMGRFLGVENFAQVVSYQELRTNEALKEVAWEAVVLDESTAIKNVNTQISFAARSLKSRFRLCLSGTPVENRFEELAGQFAFALPGGSDIKKYVLRRTKKGVGLQLPEVREQKVYLQMGEEQRALYEEVEGGGGHEVEKILRLRQIALDPALIGRPEIESVKRERLLADLAERGGQKVIVFSQFASFLEKVASNLPEALLFTGDTSAAERVKRTKAFQGGEGGEVLLMSLKAGGVGLNLTEADLIYLMEPWWNEAAEAQAIGRSHRIGQKRPLLVKRFLAIGTLEEGIEKMQEQKTHLVQELGFIHE